MFWLFDYLSTHELSLFQHIGVVISAGTLSASNINVAHELFHKDSTLDTFFGALTLSKNLYMHFRIEHVWGHHRTVATPEDPACSVVN